MPDDISPPPGFSLVGQSDAAASPQPDVAPPPGFSLVSKPAADQQPQGGTLRDMGRGLGLGLQQGAANVLGFPSDLWQMLDRGYQWTLTKAGEKMGMITPEEGAAMRQPVPGMEDYHYTSKAIMDRFKKADEALGASTADPKTVPGQYAETAGEFGVGAGALGASEAKQIPAAIAKYGMLPAATSETAGQVTKGTPLEPYARVAGAVAGAGPSMAWDAMRSGARGAAAAVDDLSPQQRQAAQSLLDQSRQAGMPLSVPEAVQHATNGASSLGDIQRVVEQSTRGGPPMRQFYAQRPGQNEQAMRQTLAGVSPQTGVPLEETTANVQKAANQTVSDADRARTQAVKPYYQAAASDQVPAQDMQNFLDRIDTMAAKDKTGILSPALTQLRDKLTFQGQPITDIENLDTVREFFRDRMAQPQWAQDAIPKKANGQVKSLLGDLKSMMETNSQPFAQGRQLYEDISNASVNPLQRSPTGQLAAADTFPKQAGILFNPNPAPGSEAAVSSAIRSVAAKDPDAAAQLVRAHIEQTFNETTQQLRSGPNQWGGAKFASVVAGNPQQAANLEAAVRALPNGDLRWNGLNNTLKIMQAQGMRQPVGSQTEFNRLMVQELRGGTALGTIMATAASPGRLSRFASDVYQNFTYGRNTQRLADLFTTGNIDDIRRLAQVPARSIVGQAAVAAYLGEGSQQQHSSPDGRASGGGLSDGPGDLDALIDQASARYGISPPLLRRVMTVESGGKQNAVSNQGALGPMQLMPATAKALGVTDPFDYSQALNAGARLLREGMDRNDGRVDLAVAEYHGGPDRRQWGPKTAAYVGKVLGPGNEPSQESPPQRSRQEPMTAEAPARPAPLRDFGDEIDPTETGGDDIDRRITAENMNLLADAAARTTA